MVHTDTVRNIARQLERAEIPVQEFIRVLLTEEELHALPPVQELFTHPTTILNLFLLLESTRKLTRKWVFDVAGFAYAEQIEALTKANAGFHFTARDVSVAQVEKCRILHLSDGMQKHAPDVWELLGQLLQADPILVQRRKRDREGRSVHKEYI
jgi:hypothetical protein